MYRAACECFLKWERGFIGNLGVVARQPIGHTISREIRARPEGGNCLSPYDYYEAVPHTL